MGSLKAMLLGLALVSMPVGAGLFRVWVHQDIVRLGYDLTEQENLRTQLHSTLQALRVQRAEARSPERLASLARALGLSAPTPDRIIAAPERSLRSVGLARVEAPIARP